MDAQLADAVHLDQISIRRRRDPRNESRSYHNHPSALSLYFGYNPVNAYVRAQQPLAVHMSAYAFETAPVCCYLMYKFMSSDASSIIIAYSDNKLMISMGYENELDKTRFWQHIQTYQRLLISRISLSLLQLDLPCSNGVKVKVERTMSPIERYSSNQ